MYRLVGFTLLAIALGGCAGCVVGMSRQASILSRYTGPHSDAQKDADYQDCNMRAGSGSRITSWLSSWSTSNSTTAIALPAVLQASKTDWMPSCPPPARPVEVWINPPKILVLVQTSAAIPTSPLAHPGAFA